MSKSPFIIKDKGMQKAMQSFQELSRLHVVVGYPGDGPMHEGGKFSVAALAITHEFGVPDMNLPSRPFMRNTWLGNKAVVKDRAKLAFTMAVRGKWSPRVALSRLGLFYEDKIRDTIDNGNFKPLSQGTIDAKGSSAILIDTGDLRRRVASKVVG